MSEITTESEHENYEQLDLMVEYKHEKHLNSSYGSYMNVKHNNTYSQQIYDFLNWVFYTNDLKLLHDNVLAIQGSEPGVLTQLFCDTLRYFYKITERETHDKLLETKMLDNRAMIYARHSKSSFAFEEIKHLNLLYRRYGMKESDERNRIHGLFANAHTIDELNCNIELLNESSNEYNIIHRYVTNSGENYFVKHIFKIERKTECESFKQFETCKRMLLFHGTPINNCYSILLNGLKASEYEKKPGIFFADMPQKSYSFSRQLSYCTGKCYNYFILFVADVAVGNLKPYSHCSGTGLPVGYRCIQCPGVWSRNMNDVAIIDNAIVPFGAPNVIENGNYYQYAEYFVGHSEQVKLKYVIVFRRL